MNDANKKAHARHVATARRSVRTFAAGQYQSEHDRDNVRHAALGKVRSAEIRAEKLCNGLAELDANAATFRAIVAELYAATPVCNLRQLEAVRLREEIRQPKPWDWMRQ